MFQNNLLMAAASAAAAGFEVTFLENTGVVAPASNPFTISGADLGSNTETKHIILAINVDAEPGPISVVTVDGETATIIIEEGSGSYKQTQVAIAIVELTDVTSGDIVITSTSSTANKYSVSTFQMLGGSITPTDTWGPSTAAAPTGTIDIDEGGFCVSVAAALTSSTFTWSGLTEQVDASGGGPAKSQAWDFEMSAETGRTITATPSGSPSQRVGIGASFKANPNYIVATGGTITTDGDYKVHTFNSSGTFAVSEVGTIGTTVEYLCIAGGGGGGKGNTLNSWGCGGAGAGGYLTATDFSVAVQDYTVTIGAGGAGASSDSSGGSKGSDSVFATITTEGGGFGGGGGSPGTAGGDGGSGGGGTRTPTPNFGSGNAGPPRQGYDGGDGTGLGHNSQAGGGGASEVGEDATPDSDTGGAGGDGLASSITGASVTRGGGGSGSSYPGPAVAGGAGGGGTGAINNTTPGTDGTANTGGGGGGGGGGSIPGRAGGSGVVIIRYQFQ